VLKRRRPRPRLNWLDRFFWTALRRDWPRWSDVLVIVKPETVIGWPRAGFRLSWRWRSRPRGGRRKTTHEIRALIRRMAEENTGWGAPKIHGPAVAAGFSGGGPIGKLPPRDAGPCHPTERAASPPADPGLRELLPPGPGSRFPRKGRAEPAARRAEAVAPGDGDIEPTSGRSPSSIFLGRSGVEPLCTVVLIVKALAKMIGDVCPAAVLAQGGDHEVTSRVRWPESVRALSVGPAKIRARRLPAEPHLPSVHRYVTSLHAAYLLLATHSREPPFTPRNACDIMMCSHCGSTASPGGSVCRVA